MDAPDKSRVSWYRAIGRSMLTVGLSLGFGGDRRVTFHHTSLFPVTVRIFFLTTTRRVCRSLWSPSSPGIINQIPPAPLENIMRWQRGLMQRLHANNEKINVGPVSGWQKIKKIKNQGPSGAAARQPGRTLSSKLTFPIKGWHLSSLPEGGLVSCDYSSDEAYLHNKCSWLSDSFLDNLLASVVENLCLMFCKHLQISFFPPVNWSESI